MQDHNRFYLFICLFYRSGAEFSKMEKNVIVDLDTGTDDAVALLLLLTSEIELDHKIIGVTCTVGNTDVDYVCTNTLRTLETIDRLDVS